MNQRRVDLHVHSNFSDGTFSPREVIEEAHKRGISVIGLCDHDCLDGIEEALKAGSEYGIEVIPGVELTLDVKGVEVHLLGYFIDWHDEAFLEKLVQMREARQRRAYAIVDKLKQAGVELDPKIVFEISGEGSVGRLHVAKALLKIGKVKTIQEAFNRYLGVGKPAYMEKLSFTPQEAIDTIHRLGGVSVLAHPGLMGKDEFIPEYVEAGLDAIEVWHTDHRDNHVKKYKAITEEFNLVATGGSDCHGYGKGKILMGKVTVDYSVVEKLKNVIRDS